jgi:hypothetical protein
LSYFWRVLSILKNCAGLSRPAEMSEFSTKNLKISDAKKTETKVESNFMPILHYNFGTKINS